MFGSWRRKQTKPLTSCSPVNPVAVIVGAVRFLSVAIPEAHCVCDACPAGASPPCVPSESVLPERPDARAFFAARPERCDDGATAAALPLSLLGAFLAFSAAAGDGCDGAAGGTVGACEAAAP